MKLNEFKEKLQIFLELGVKWRNSELFGLNSKEETEELINARLELLSMFNESKWQYRNANGDFEELPKIEKLVAFQYKEEYKNGTYDIISCCDDDFRIVQFKKFANQYWYRWCYLPE
jgi:hypothetical protein